MPFSPDQIRRALGLLADAAIADAQTLFSVADPRTVVTQELFPIVQHYADGAAALGADYYDEIREVADVAGRPYVAQAISEVSEESLRRGALWAAEPLFQDELDLGLAQSRLASVVQPAVVNPFRDTITGNQRIDPAAVGYRRSASNGCKFCRMLASRGVVYRNNVHFASHPHCDCTASPVFENGDAGPEASVMQYVASQRHRTPAQQAALRQHLSRMPDVPTPRPVNPLQAELTPARTPRRPKYGDQELADVAAKYDVSVDEVRVARSEVVDIRRRIRDEAAARSAESFRILDAADALSIRRRTAGARGGEYDWLERLNPQEVTRLNRGGRWLTKESTYNTVDDVAERLRETVPGLRNLTDDEVIRTVWLHHNRQIEAAGAIRRGRIPSPRQYSGSINPRDFAPIVESEGYSVTLLMSVDDLEAAAHIAQVRHIQYADEAARLLDSYTTGLGPSPWEMSFQAWESEVRTLENAIATNDTLDITVDQARRRIRELIPPELDGNNFSYEDAYSSVVTTARMADFKVPSHAVIEWEV